MESTNLVESRIQSYIKTDGKCKKGGIHFEGYDYDVWELQIGNFVLMTNEYDGGTYFNNSSCSTTHDWVDITDFDMSDLLALESFVEKFSLIQSNLSDLQNKYMK